MPQNLKALYIQNGLAANYKIQALLDAMNIDTMHCLSFTLAKEQLQKQKFQMVFLPLLSNGITDEKIKQIKKEAEIAPLVVGINPREMNGALQEGPLDAVLNPLEDENNLRISLRNLLQSYLILKDPEYLQYINVFRSNIFDSRYFRFFYKFHYKMGLKHLLFVLKDFRSSIIDMYRISDIYQHEPGIYEFFKENCEHLIKYAQQSGAHKVRKMIRINLNLMEQKKWQKLVNFQKDFREALNETKLELNRLIANVEP